MEDYNLSQTLENLTGPTPELIKVNNDWAAVALDRYHKDSKVKIEFEIDGTSKKSNLSWDSKFPKAAMKENKDMANHGGVALAWFVMSVILDYGYVEQSEIGEGVDYRFMKTEPDDDNLNFLNDFHYVEISGILEEKKSNTLKGRIKDKHAQINRGSRSGYPSSVIVTLFSKPSTVKEIHN